MAREYFDDWLVEITACEGKAPVVGLTLLSPEPVASSKYRLYSQKEDDGIKGSQDRLTGSTTDGPTTRPAL